SSERIYGEIYGRGSQFFLWFAATSVVMAGFTFATGKVVARLGTTRALRGVMALLVAASLMQCVAAFMTDGVPSFAFFFVTTTIMVSLNTAMTPLLTSRALSDVGHLAGTAASTIGGIGLIGSALLSPWVDDAIGSTITPFSAGYLLFSVCAVACAWIADRVSAGKVASSV
ncbi:MAG: hypothetical protein AAF368_13725, partial [Planctomycetota bacterium]